MAFSTKLPTASLRTLSLTTLVVAGLLVHSDSVAPVSRRMMQLPRLTLWVWERPEDLRSLDPAITAIAYLDRTVQIGHDGGVRVELRSQAAVFPWKTSATAVVRLEVEPGTIISPEIQERALAALIASAKQAGISTFQVDFDATRSQREFYRKLLIDLRQAMPPDLPLSITALASWCSWDDWIHGLPVDEAVPMFFRMEPDRLRGQAPRAEYRVRERLCQGSVGVSTREPWPEQEVSGKRIYFFPDRGWRQDASLLAAELHLRRSP